MTRSKRAENEIIPALYCRWSTDEQTDGTSCEVQKSGGMSFAASQGWTISASSIYIDDGYTGGNIERPALSRLRADINAGRINMVIVYKLDRLSRSLVDTVNLVIQEWAGKAELRSGA